MSTAPTPRIVKVNELLYRTLGTLIAREVEFPPNCFVSISHVETARDLAHANVFITILPDSKRVTGMRVLSRDLPHLQHLLGKKIKMHNTPKLHLVFDRAQMTAQHLFDVMDRIHKTN